jgi:hypothetical protein
MDQAAFAECTSGKMKEGKGYLNPVNNENKKNGSHELLNCFGQCSSYFARSGCIHVAV